MSGGAFADRLRPKVSAPSPKDKRHTWQRWFARFPSAWHSILATTPPPANPGKTVERRSVAAGQDVTVTPATACVRQSRYDNRAVEKEFRHLLDVALPASPSVPRRPNRRQSVQAPRPRACA